MTLIQDMATYFGVGSADLRRIIRTAPKRYKIYPIKKRHGGDRIIAQPSTELKAIQRYVIDKALSRLPVHPAATGYVIGKNILQNAEPHRRNRVILKLDFKEFFPSLTVSDWRRYVQQSQACEQLRPDFNLYANILFWGVRTVKPICLSIGAPSSPILSNILMYELDEKFSQFVEKAGLAYTRYADDITISGGNVEAVKEFENFARKLIKDTRTPRLKFNDEKRGLYLRGQRRMVTGLVITPSGSISVGRERKRLISAMLHHVLNDRADATSMAHLKGLLGFCIANEPSFLDRLRAKYGDGVVEKVLVYQIPPRIH